MFLIYYQVSWNCTVPWALIWSPFTSVDSRPHGGCSHNHLSKQFCWMNILPFFLLFSVSFLTIGEDKNKNAVVSGNSSAPISLFLTRGHNNLHSNKLWCLKTDWFLSIWPPTHGWIGHRPISSPFPFSSYWFNWHDFNKAPFPSAL